jgi:hypothetical protein
LQVAQPVVNLTAAAVAVVLAVIDAQYLVNLLAVVVLPKHL